MKTTLAIIFVLLFNNLYAQIDSQNVSVESEIRELEQQQVDHLLKNEINEMQSHWSKEFTVNNPFNRIVNANEGPIREGTLTYSSFIRKIDYIKQFGETVIVMGRETVVPKDDSPGAGRKIERRFTNIWMKENGIWLMTARHANNICE